MDNQTKKNINDLRDHLFAQMDRLSDPSCDLDKELKKANAFVNIGNVLVNSAKAEVDFIKLTKAKGSGFIGDQKQLGDGKE